MGIDGWNQLNRATIESTKKSPFQSHLIKSVARPMDRAQWRLQKFCLGGLLKILIKKDLEYIEVPTQKKKKKKLSSYNLYTYIKNYFFC